MAEVKSSCCEPEVISETTSEAAGEAGCHPATKKRPDLLLWGSLAGVALLYVLHWIAGSALGPGLWLTTLAA